MEQKPIVLIQISRLNKEHEELVRELTQIDEHLNAKFKDEMNIFLVANNIEEDIKIECINPTPIPQAGYDDILDRLFELEQSVKNL